MLLFLLNVGYKFLLVKKGSHLFLDFGKGLVSKMSIIFLNISNEPSSPFLVTTEKSSRLV